MRRARAGHARRAAADACRRVGTRRHPVAAEGDAGARHLRQRASRRAGQRRPDSVRTDARGRYTVRYTRFGSEDALYFAAAVYNGIAYFTAPLRGERVEGDDAEITVFDTTSRPVTLTIQGHHIVVSAPNANGGREIVEVYELSNDTTATVVPR